MKWWRRLRGVLRPGGLLGRLTLGYLGILVIALTAVGVFQYFALQSFLQADLAANLRNQAHYAIQARGGANQALSDLNALAKSASSPDARAAIYDSYGSQLAVGPAGPRHLAWIDPTSVSVLRATQNRPSDYQLLESAGTRLLAVAEPVGKPQSATAFIVLEGSMTGTDAVLMEDLEIFVVAGLVTLLLAGALGLLLTGRALRQLTELSTTASAIASGDWNRRARIRGSDEIAVLGAAFDGMVQRLEEEILRKDESEAAMRRLLGDASHELRTPLTALRVNLDVLRRGAISAPEDLRSSLTDMHTSVVRMSRLVYELLTLARIDQGVGIRLASTELGTLLKEAARTGRDVAPDHVIRLEMQEPISIWADPDAVQRVLLNLVDNAAKYSPPGKEIVLRSLHNGAGRVVVEVEDHGSGIDKRDRERVFERFYRADKSRKSGSVTGAGLGLAICAALMKRLGGAISVRETPGGGSTFVLEFQMPAAVAQA